MKICGCKRWCPKHLPVRAPAAPILTHSLNTYFVCSWKKAVQSIIYDNIGNCSSCSKSEMFHFLIHQFYEYRISGNSFRSIIINYYIHISKVNAETIWKYLHISTSKFPYSGKYGNCFYFIVIHILTANFFFDA